MKKPVIRQDDHDHPPDAYPSSYESWVMVGWFIFAAMVIVGGLSLAAHFGLIDLSVKPKKSQNAVMIIGKATK